MIVLVGEIALEEKLVSYKENRSSLSPTRHWITPFFRIFLPLPSHFQTIFLLLYLFLPSSRLFSVCSSAVYFSVTACPFYSPSLFIMLLYTGLCKYLNLSFFSSLVILYCFLFLTLLDLISHAISIFSSLNISFRLIFSLTISIFLTLNLRAFLN